MPKVKYIFWEPSLVENYNVWYNFCHTSLEFKNLGHIQVGIGFPKFAKGDVSLAVVVQDRYIRARIYNTRITDSYHYYNHCSHPDTDEPKFESWKSWVLFDLPRDRLCLKGLYDIWYSSVILDSRLVKKKVQQMLIKARKQFWQA